MQCWYCKSDPSRFQSSHVEIKPITHSCSFPIEWLLKKVTKHGISGLSSWRDNTSWGSIQRVHSSLELQFEPCDRVDMCFERFVTMFPAAKKGA
jgi:hypothetical protein